MSERSVMHPVGGFGPEVGVPQPPPGPGVAPPFAAPPTDKNKRGLWIGLGIGGLVLVLCCVGGVFGLGVLIVSSTEEAKRQATATVRLYLDSLRADNVEQAYSTYCASLADEVSASDLARTNRQRRIVSYTLDPAEFTSVGIGIVAHLSTSGGAVKETYQLATEGSELRICDIS